ncbi:low-density lipoprotein receptor-related protein 3-like isoform X2 [Varroa destructor]|uniref:CUB domain-containing protein n=1 Tax=Varroa destructor TaxID=109461 RepID=A0A7M7JWB9_VARDE|nr:low-density lipoprotein receptor-related protein 3-like isoform X2 [Varroa destructor]
MFQGVIVALSQPVGLYATASSGLGMMGRLSLASRSSSFGHLPHKYSICGNYSQFNLEGYIVSPDATLDEHEDVNCTLEIKADESEVITIHFMEFAIEGPEMEQGPPRLTVCGSLWEPGSVPPCCLGAMLKVAELRSSKGRLRDALRGHSASLTGDKVQQNFYCGKGPHAPQPFLSVGNGASIQFVSVGALSPRGHNATRSFRLHYLVSKVGGSCAEREFQCLSDRKCIPESWKCNMLRECEDGSDEKGCNLPLDTREGSHRDGQETHQQLGSGGSRTRGEIYTNPYPVLGMGIGIGQGEYRIKHDCADREDFPCGTRSKECFSIQQHCDGVFDCPNKYDELRCPPRAIDPPAIYTLCKKFKGNATRCSPSSLYCYSRDTHCNGVLDCPRGEDERGCDSRCPELIPCRGDDPCGFLEEQRCNGHDECRDGFDEMNCQRESCEHRHGGFLCSDGRCIALDRRCDHAVDCAGADDEMYCIKNSVITAAIMGSLVCGILIVIAISCTCRLYALRLISYQRQQNCSSASGTNTSDNGGGHHDGERFRRRSSISDSDLLRFDALQDLYCYYGFRDPPPPYSVAVAGDPPAIPPPPLGSSGRRRRSRAHHSRIYARRSSSNPAGSGPEFGPSGSGRSGTPPSSSAEPLPPPSLSPSPSLDAPESPKQGTSSQHSQSRSAFQEQPHLQQMASSSSNDGPSVPSPNCDNARDAASYRRQTSLGRNHRDYSPSQTTDKLVDRTTTTINVCEDNARESHQRDAREHLNAPVHCVHSTDLGGSGNVSTTEIEFSVLPLRSLSDRQSQSVIAVGVEVTSPTTDDQPLIAE